VPDDLMPIVTVVGASAEAVSNDPALTKRVRAAVTGWLGAGHVETSEPIMGSEDFSQYGKTAERVPLCFFWLGAAAPEALAESRRTGVPLPFPHSSKFAPDMEPTLRTGVAAMTAAALDILAKN